MKRKQLLISTTVIVILSVGYIFRPYKKPNLTLVCPELLALAEPIKDVKLYAFGDGGSIGLTLIDSLDQSLNLCIPAPLDEPTYEYKKIFIGAVYYTDKNTTEVINPKHTKIKLAEILRKMPDEDGDLAWVIYLLSRRLKDLIPLLKNKPSTQASHEN